MCICIPNKKIKEQNQNIGTYVEMRRQMFLTHLLELFLLFWKYSYTFFDIMRTRILGRTHFNFFFFFFLLEFLLLFGLSAFFLSLNLVFEFDLDLDLSLDLEQDSF